MVPEPTIDPRVTKILADLLGLALSDNAPQGEAALSAIRRRAQHDGVTGGAVKALAARLMEPGRGVAPTMDAQDREYRDLRWTVDDQLRELEQTRHARQLAEAALSDTKKINHSLASQIGRLDAARRDSRVLGFVAGLACGIALWIGVDVARYLVSQSGAARGIGGASASLNVPAARALDDKLRVCFLTSGNSLGGGTSFAMHILLDVTAAGTIGGVSLAADQADDMDDDPQKKIYAALVLRTLAHGGCGTLPLPASLRGRADHLDLYLPP